MKWGRGAIFFEWSETTLFSVFFSDEDFPKIFWLLSKHLLIRLWWLIECTLFLSVYFLTATSCCYLYSRSWHHDWCTVHLYCTGSYRFTQHRYSNCNLVWFQMIFIGCLKANQNDQSFPGTHRPTKSRMEAGTLPKNNIWQTSLWRSTNQYMLW